jgi:putative folate metabolism gamma-glutamate ligase
MEIKTCSTHVIQPGEDILEVLDTHFPSIAEGTILAITSKILSVCANRIVSKESIAKIDLIQREADAFLESELHNHLTLTIKNGLLIPAAGIDESNCENGYILYPENIQADAVRIWEHLRAKHRLKELGVVITDSRTTPLRRGVTGVALGWCGFVPFYNYIGKLDLFARPLKVTVCNTLDALATAAVFLMGEGDEQTPIAVIQGAPKITFLDRAPSEEEIQFLTLSMEEDLYAPLLTAVAWKSGSSR